MWSFSGCQMTSSPGVTLPTKERDIKYVISQDRQQHSEVQINKRVAAVVASRGTTHHLLGLLFFERTKLKDIIR